MAATEFGPVVVGNHADLQDAFRRRIQRGHEAVITLDARVDHVRAVDIIVVDS